jgi:hypothetical protein
MSNPSRLFELSKQNIIIHEFLQIWQNGGIEWERALFGMHDHLLKRCFDIKDRARLNIDLEDICDLNLPKDDGVRTFATLMETRSIEIKRQEYLIEKIDRLAILMKCMEDEAVDKVARSPFVYRMSVDKP